MKILKNLILVPDSTFFKIFQKKIVANIGKLLDLRCKHFRKDQKFKGQSNTHTQKEEIFGHLQKLICVILLSNLGQK